MFGFEVVEEKVVKDYHVCGCEWDKHSTAALIARHSKYPIAAEYERHNISSGRDSEHCTFYNESCDSLELKAIIVGNVRVNINPANPEPCFKIRDFIFILEKEYDYYSSFYNYTKETKHVIKVKEVKNAEYVGELPVVILNGSRIVNSGRESSETKLVRVYKVYKITGRPAIVKVHEYYRDYDEAVTVNPVVYEDPETGEIVEEYPDPVTEYDREHTYIF